MTNSKAGKASLWQCGRQQLRVGRSVLTPPFPPRANPAQHRPAQRDSRPAQGSRLGHGKRAPSWLEHLSGGRKLGPEL